MALFIGNFENKLDKKGRVSVPAPFRAALESESFRGVVLAPPLVDQPCVDGYPYSQIEALGGALAQMNPLSEEYHALATIVLAQAIQLAFDSEGRMVLPDSVIERAGLEETVTFAGMGSKFQLWAPERFKAFSEEARGMARDSVGQLPWGVTPGSGARS